MQYARGEANLRSSTKGVSVLRLHQNVAHHRLEAPGNIFNGNFTSSTDPGRRILATIAGNEQKGNALSAHIFLRGTNKSGRRRGREPTPTCRFVPPPFALRGEPSQCYRPVQHSTRVLPSDRLGRGTV